MGNDEIDAAIQALLDAEESGVTEHLDAALAIDRDELVSELLNRLEKKTEFPQIRARLASLFYYLWSGAYDGLLTKEFQAENPTFRVIPADVTPPTIEQATRYVQLGCDETDVSILESFASSIRAIFTDLRVIPAPIAEAVRNFCHEHGAGKSAFLDHTCRAVLNDWRTTESF